MPGEIPQQYPEKLITDKALAEEMAYAEDGNRVQEKYWKTQLQPPVSPEEWRKPEYHAALADKAGEAARQEYENPGQVERPKEQEDPEWLSSHLSPQTTKKRGQVALYDAPGGFVQGQIVSGGPGGPAVVETPGGKVAVDKLSIP